MSLLRVVHAPNLRGLLLVTCIALLGVGDVAAGHDACNELQYEEGDVILYRDDRRPIKARIESVTPNGFEVSFFNRTGKEWIHKSSVIAELVVDHRRSGAEVYFREGGETFFATVEEVYVRRSRRNIEQVLVRVHSVESSDGRRKPITPYDKLLPKEIIKFTNQCRRRR